MCIVSFPSPLASEYMQAAYVLGLDSDMSRNFNSEKILKIKGENIQNEISRERRRKTTTSIENQLLYSTIGHSRVNCESEPIRQIDLDWPRRVHHLVSSRYK